MLMTKTSPWNALPERLRRQRAHRPTPPAPSSPASRILITGAGAYIGSALARRARLPSAVKSTRCCSTSPSTASLTLDQDLHRPARSYRPRLIVGRHLTTPPFLHQRLHHEFQPHIVFHAAALQTCSRCTEANPFTAAQHQRSSAPKRILHRTPTPARVGQVIVLSTDKAADPHRHHGRNQAAKPSSSPSRNAGPARAKVCPPSQRPRLHAAPSAPLFLHQAQRAPNPLTVTDSALHPATSSAIETGRPHISSSAAWQSTSATRPCRHPGSPRLPYRILRTSRTSLLQKASSSATNEIIYTGLRSGEKLQRKDAELPPKQLLPHPTSTLFVSFYPDIQTSHPVPSSRIVLDQHLSLLAEALKERNLPVNSSTPSTGPSPNIKPIHAISDAFRSTKQK